MIRERLALIGQWKNRMTEQSVITALPGTAHATWRSPGLLGKIRRSLGRDRDLSLNERLRKGLRSASSLISGPVYLRRCTRVGSRPRTLCRPTINNRGRILIGDDFNLNSTFVPTEITTGPEGVIEIGSSVRINFGGLVAARSRVTIG